MRKVFIAAALVLVGATAASAQVEPQVLEITSGGLVFLNTDGTLSITLKARQFSLGGGTAGVQSGRFYPHETNCECLPGQTYPLDAGWSGSDFTGTAKVDKTIYEFGMESESTGYADVTFSGEWQAPVFDGRTERKVTAPFTFEGIFRLPFTESGNGAEYALTGSGRATLHFIWGGDRWLLESAKYQFTR